MRILDIRPNTPEWLEKRKNSLGSSDSPVIMDCSPWKTSFELWQERCGLEKENVSNWATERGHLLEPLVLARLEKELNCILTPEFVQHDSFDWLTASLDGLSFDHEFFTEIKCPNSEDHELALQNKIPEKYKWQITKQFSVTGCKKGLYASYNPTFEKDLVYFWVDKDDQLIDILFKKEQIFWQHVLDKIPPALCSKDFVDLSTDPEWQFLSEEYKLLVEEEKFLESKKERIKSKLIRLSNNSNAKGCGLKISRETKMGNVDYKAIPELKGIDLEKFRKEPVTYFRINTNFT